MRTFGLQNTKDYLTRLLENVDRVDSITAQMLVVSAYETDFGIFNHPAHARTTPYALARMSFKEDYLTDGVREEYAKNFRRARVRHHYGYNFTEFLELEMWFADFIIDDCNAAEKEESKRAGNILSESEAMRREFNKKLDTKNN